MEQNQFNNSNKYKKEQAEAAAEEAKKQEKIVSSAVKVKKKDGLRKLADNFAVEKAPSIKTYFVKDIVVPMIEKTITGIIDIIFHGTPSRSRTTNASRASYRSYYDEPRTIRDTPARSIAYSYDDIIIADRGEAEEVLLRLNELIDLYKIARVADLYDLVGITGSYTDNNYGWTDLRTASVERVRDGFMLRLPRALPIR